MLERHLLVGTMSAQIEQHLGMRIVAGEFPPGSLLPIENEICEAYSVSRTVVREAVKALVAKRLVEVSPRIGTRILPFSDWNLLDRDLLAWRLAAKFDDKILEDIFEMRLCFEPRAAFLAARDGTKEDHATIRRHCNDIANAYATGLPPRIVAESSLAFHLAVINASRNGLFITIGSAVKSALRLSFDHKNSQPIDPGKDVALHEAVMQAITQRQTEVAAQSMKSLLLAWRQSLLPLIAA